MVFRFRLARVLNFLELKEREKKMEVASLVRKKESLAQRRNEMELQIVGLLTKSQEEKDFSGSWSTFRAQKISLNRSEMTSLDRQIESTQVLLDDKRWELSRMSMRKKAVEELREKKKREFEVEESRKDQKRLDEGFRMSKLGKTS